MSGSNIFESSWYRDGASLFLGVSMMRGSIVLFLSFLAVSCGGGGSGGSAAGSGGPTATIAASPPGVPPGGTTTVQWRAANVDTCVASGAWSGTKSLAGSETVGPLNSDETYELTCSGPQGSALAMTTVTIRFVHVAWAAPTTNTDGSPLVDLAGFRLRWGPASRRYDHSADVTDPSATSFDTPLDPGTWYFVISAINSADVESMPSNEASKTVF
jgi:hypothetical protein